MITESKIRQIVREEVERMAVFQEAEALANTSRANTGKTQDTLIKYKRQLEEVMPRLAQVYKNLKQDGSSEDLHKVFELLKVLTANKKSAVKKLEASKKRFDPPANSK